MFKKIVLIVLAFALALGCTNAKAAGFVTNSITDLSMDAQHYYHTKVDYADMVVTHVDDALYEVLHYTQSGKMLKLQLYKTPWGTWNLGDFSLVDNSGIPKTVIGGGTDWEYVFRVFNPITQNLEFTGGNHGSEVCSSLVMYDSVTGLAVNPAIGESMYVNRLVIEEDTTILLANVDYLPYANVKRVYTVVGDRVNLDCKVTFTRDVKMAMSYTTMACVNKDFSRYSNFDSLAYHTTEARGASTGAYYGHVPASVCHLYGDDLQATVTVGIFNEKDMTDNFSNRDKTFIWDMSDGFNKLYFSKYSLTTLETITAGTVWDFASFWQINVQ